MPLWTAETTSSYYISREIPMALLANLSGPPMTTEVDRELSFNILTSETVRTLNGRWLVLAWRAKPSQPGVVASVSLEVDTLLVFQDAFFRENEYMVGPSKSRTDPTSSSSIPRFVMSESQVVFRGQCTSGTALDTEYFCVKME